jgi:hypothetical protein
VWSGLFAVIALGIITVIALAGGTADPPRAGPLIYRSDKADNIPLPSSPYTLEVIGHLSTTSDPGAAWGIEITGVVAKGASINIGSPSLLAERGSPLGSLDGLLAQPLFDPKGRGEVNISLRILLNGYGFFAVLPSQPDFTPFIHIHIHGESNKLTLNVGKDGQSVLRINDEIAWKGIIPHARSSAARLIIPAGFTLEHVAVYASQTIIPH